MQASTTRRRLSALLLLQAGITTYFFELNSVTGWPAIIPPSPGGMKEAPHFVTKTIAQQYYKQEPFVIFYNIYVPLEAERKVNALRIIEEQLGQIGESHAATSFAKPTKIYYNTVGAPHLLNSTHMEKLCGAHFNLECVHLKHYKRGTEEHTLAQVQEYCQRPMDYDAKSSSINDTSDFQQQAVDSPRVVYMHNKGSFHQHEFNEHWRRLMTYAVTSESCLHPPDKTCNLCGLYFVAERGMFMAGNFWTAKCDYISQLLSPYEFLEGSIALLKDVLVMELQNNFDTSLFDHRFDNFGAGRYANEMWSASHPSLQPCDLTLGKKKSFRQDFMGWVRSQEDPFQKAEKSLAWSMYPSFPLELPFHLKTQGLPGLLYSLSDNTISTELKRHRQFFLLAGNIYKWQRLYNQVPPPSSWVWKWFPDGDFWISAVDQYGEGAMERVTAGAD